MSSAKEACPRCGHLLETWLDKSVCQNCGFNMGDKLKNATKKNIVTVFEGAEETLGETVTGWLKNLTVGFLWALGIMAFVMFIYSWVVSWIVGLIVLLAAIGLAIAFFYAGRRIALLAGWKSIIISNTITFFLAVGLSLLWVAFGADPFVTYLGVGIILIITVIIGLLYFVLVKAWEKQVIELTTKVKVIFEILPIVAIVLGILAVILAFV